MNQPPIDLSLTALALLGAIVDHADIDSGRLREFVPQALSGSSWTEQLQALIDLGLVISVDGSGQYLYRATGYGIATLRAYLHPSAARLRSVS
jgi:hypothetical protein